MNRAGDAWRRLPTAARVAAGVIAGLVALNLAARALDATVGGSEPGGAPSSSYGTAPEGIAAYGELLSRWGHPIERRRGPLDRQELDPSGTLMVLDPESLPTEEVVAVSDFVSRGGRLVIGGWLPQRYLHDLGGLGDDPPEWVGAGPQTFDQIDPSLADVGRVETAGWGAWESYGSTEPLVESAGGDGALLTSARVGEGEILLLADVAPLQNEYLTEADNAALGVLLAGGEGRRVVFAEGIHGYGTSRGLDALPDRWKLALRCLLAAALVLVWARGRRLGPPEDAFRPLPPARGQYVDALAVTMSRAGGQSAALAPVASAVRERLLARRGLGPDAGADQIEAAARAAGLSDEETAALLGPVETLETDEAALALGRALARVQQWQPGRGRL